jgi:hypothetical protein
MQERRSPPKACRSHSICPNFAGIYEAPLILLLVLSQTHVVILLLPASTALPMRKYRATTFLMSIMPSLKYYGRN